MRKLKQFEKFTSHPENRFTSLEKWLGDAPCEVDRGIFMQFFNYTDWETDTHQDWDGYTVKEIDGKYYYLGITPNIRQLNELREFKEKVQSVFGVNE